MAYIKINDYNTAHLIKRAKERYSSFQELEVQRVKDHIYRIINILENQAPDDWRFTRNPTAIFIILDEKTKLRILGRSYRDVGEGIIEEIKKLQGSFSSSADEAHQLDKVGAMYMEAIKKPGAKICHALKTCPRKDAPISLAKDIFLAVKDNLLHCVPLEAKRSAARPNALITVEDELWVRQDEWVNPGERNQEYLLFQRLLHEGIDKSVIRVYSHNSSKGEIKFVDEKKYKGIKQPLILQIEKTFWKNQRNPGDFHTESYWYLPIYPEFKVMDLKYKKIKNPTIMNGEDLFILSIWDEITKRIKVKLEKN